MTMPIDSTSAAASTSIAAADHAGPFYRVAGPLDIPRPPQGRLPRVGDDSTADVSFSEWIGVVADPTAWRKLRARFEPGVADTAGRPPRTLRRELGLSDIPPQYSNRLAAAPNP